MKSSEIQVHAMYDDATVKIEILADGKVAASYSMPNGAVGAVSAMLLMAAGTALDEATKRNPGAIIPAEANEFLYVLPSQFGIAPSKRPQHVAFVFLCGRSRIAFDMPINTLGELAQTLTTLSADGGKH